MGGYAMRPAAIVYFEQEGNNNLQDVIRTLKKQLKKREELRTKKIVIFTAFGEGPLLAYNALSNLVGNYEPTMIAVTFPPDFSVSRQGERISPRISDRLLKFFDGVGITVITTRLPFDKIKGAAANNADLDLIAKVLRLFGGGLTQCIQAALQACDAGKVCSGEQVIAVTGDWAVLLTASTTSNFLEREGGMEINEIFCRPRNLNIARRPIKNSKMIDAQRTLELAKPERRRLDTGNEEREYEQ
jgi:hypothetical protein